MTQVKESFPKVYDLYFIYHAYEKEDLEGGWRPKEFKC